MKAWLYDEDRWPSGAAGGLVTKHHAFRMKTLQFTLAKKRAFGVHDQQTITPLPKVLHMGDWCNQGLPNYSANVTYICHVELPSSALKKRHAIEIPEWNGTALGISVNGAPVEIIGWPPYQLDVEKWLKAGRNTIEITVIGNRRNAFGPFYTREKTLPWIGPQELRRHDISEKRLIPEGLLAPVNLLTLK